MSGWLDLTQQGLSPCKKRQASLGALTPGITRPLLPLMLRAALMRVGCMPLF